MFGVNIYLGCDGLYCLLFGYWNIVLFFLDIVLRLVLCNIK